MAPAYDALAPVHDPEERDAALTRMRREAPVHWDEREGWWILTRHADVREVSRRPELFSSVPRGPWHVFEGHFSMQAMDGKEHLRHRNVVSRAFTPRMVSMLEERAAGYIDEAIDALRDRSGCEFVQDLAVPVPLRIIADLLGVPDGDLDSFRRWSDAAVVAGSSATAGQKAAASAPMADFRAFLVEAVAKRRAQPGEDLLSAIIQADDAGLLSNDLSMSENEVVDFALFLLIAGNETTRNAISQGMLALFQHPEARRRLSQDPSLWSTAADEILRWTSPVRAMRRVAMRDTELGGRRIRAGDSVVMIYASANRDEEVFEAPFEFRVDRTPNEHIAFGIGPHYCLGANLARLEVRIALGRILERLPGLRPAPGTAPTQTPSALIDGLDALPVVF